MAKKKRFFLLLPVIGIAAILIVQNLWDKSHGDPYTLTYLNPLRYFLVIVRGIFLKGIGLAVLWPQMVALTLMGVAVLWLASRRFHKTLA